ncbi:MAG: aminopeptidase [Burkholderiales bacterium]|nr:aminopeptidase [Burkholderiales bacterium]
MRLGRLLIMASAAGVLLVAVAAGTLCLSSGCSSVGYLAQSASGHLGLLHGAKPVNEWLQNPATPESLKQRLALTQRMRDFAVSELAEPDNHSYRRYADIARPAAVWNVVAAPELSLTLQTWCFPIVGCVGYRGYFNQTDAEAAAQALRAEAAPGALEVSVYAVPAYSTLGYSDWLGGDPLLSSFVQWPEGELARLIFHELSHQVVYVAGDTMFNESFATSVERLGGERWLAAHASEPARQQYRQFDGRRQDLRMLLLRTREQLAALYAGPGADAAKRERKAAIMAAMLREYAEVKARRWAGYAGYDAYVQNANNATLGIQAAYTQWVPAFDALFEQQGRDFKRYYAEVKRLATLPKAERDATLYALMPASAGH